ncbi:glycosyltransferase family 2 protein [Clostridium felsineum]|uniref:Glycosyltransferase 2-like domain-containing protein n=1 Tax=Clostridium felsineum TaxID=36839 RepID=A0A1S8LTY8_9CLOT|nr:glycosyltransferase [Clostridium felsineum]URZ06886.1 hypothetical protein CLROS_022190 [Clostridium felsineum]URZ11918.1 hypothetical protein CROST_026350 [Clostridium felsineum]
MTTNTLKFNTTNLRNRFYHKNSPYVSIVTVTNKLNYFNNIIKNYSRIKYKNKELIIVFNIDNINIEHYNNYVKNFLNVRVFHIEEKYSLGYCLNFGISISKHNYIAKMDDDDYYGANYLTDEINAFNYTDAKIIGKSRYFTYFEDTNEIGINKNPTHRYVISIAGGTLLFKKDLFKYHKFRPLNIGEDVSFLKDCFNHGIKIYSVDPFNYVYIRHKSLEEHSWKVPSQILKNQYLKLYKITDYVSIVKI